jgi:hypothetical protein
MITFVIGLACGAGVVGLFFYAYVADVRRQS